MLLLDDLLLSPIKGIQFVLRTVQRVAEEQWTDDAPLKERLLELQLGLESGELSEEDYLKAESSIMRELRQIEQRRRQLAGAPPDERRTGS